MLTFMFFCCCCTCRFVFVHCNSGKGGWRPYLDVQIFLGLINYGYKWSQFNSHMSSFMTHITIPISWKACFSSPIHHSCIFGGTVFRWVWYAHEWIVWTISSAAIESQNILSLFFCCPLPYDQAPLSHCTVTRLHWVTVRCQRQHVISLEPIPPLCYVGGWLKWFCFCLSAWQSTSRFFL